MGGAHSTTTGYSLYTAAVAKYVSVTKPQIMAVRNTLILVASPKRGTVQREQLRHALRQAGVAPAPDADVFDLLYTMWDVKGTNRVVGTEFMVGVSVLACKDDSIEQAIRFALQVGDRNRKGTISSNDASVFLRSKCVRTRQSRNGSSQCAFCCSYRVNLTNANARNSPLTRQAFARRRRTLGTLCWN